MTCVYWNYHYLSLIAPLCCFCPIWSMCDFIVSLNLHIDHACWCTMYGHHKPPFRRVPVYFLYSSRWNAMYLYGQMNVNRCAFFLHLPTSEFVWLLIKKGHYRFSSSVFIFFVSNILDKRVKTWGTFGRSKNSDNLAHVAGGCGQTTLIEGEAW